MIVGSPGAVVDRAEASCVRGSCILAYHVDWARGDLLSPVLRWCMSLLSMSQLDLACSSLWVLYVPEPNHCHSVAARKQFQKDSGRELKRLDGGWLCYNIACCLIQ